MIKKKLLLFFICVVIFRSFSFSTTFSKVLNIGSDKPNYEFFLITSVDTDKQGNIYIADSKGYFIRKYSKKGKFIKEIGEKGKGPGDFAGPIDLTVANNNVYILDPGNNRISVYDLEFKKKPVYYKLKNIGYPTNIIYMDNLLYLPLMSQLDPSKNDYRIIVIKLNHKIKKLKSFFNNVQDYHKKGNKTKVQMAKLMAYSVLIISTNSVKNEVVATFMFPGKKVALYYYNNKGKFIKKQGFDIIKRYKFPKFLLNYPTNYPKEFLYTMVDSLNYYKNRYLLLHYKLLKVKRINGKPRSKNTSWILIIDTETGKIIEKKSMPPTIRIFKIKGDYMYAKDFNDDIEQLHIYKIKGIK